MKNANVGDLKNNLSKFLAMVEKGEEVVICKRNIPIARIVPVDQGQTVNRTRLGRGAGTVEIHGDLTDPLIPSEAWKMFSDETTP